jgi:DNA-binding NtrC family response regulator
VRIIVATHKDLREEARRGTFRSDLFYRLNVLTIHIPALRERLADMPLLVQHFLQRQSRLLGRSFTITAEALAAMQRYNWPGNVRELENMLERVSYLMPKDTITLNDLPTEFQQRIESAELHNPDQLRSNQDWQQDTPVTEKSRALKEHSSNAEVQAILQALHASNNEVTRAAALLGISRTTLWRKMVKYGLNDGSHTLNT